MVIHLNEKKCIGKRLANFNSKNYDVGIKGQCVWYVQGRFLEKTGISVGQLPNAKDCYNRLKSLSYITCKKFPFDNSIACFNGGQYGHVIFIEEVIGDVVYYSESNSNSDNIISNDDGIIKKTTRQEFLKRPNLQGFCGLRFAIQKVLTPKKNIGLYLTPDFKKRSILITANNITSLSKSKFKHKNRVILKVVYKNKIYYAIKKTTKKFLQLRWLYKI